MHDCRPGRTAAPELIAALMDGAGALLHCLELQIGAASKQGAEFYGRKFKETESPLRETLRQTRITAICLPAERRPLHTATVLTAFSELLTSISRTAYAASKRMKRRHR